MVFLGVFIESVVFLGVFIESVVFLDVLLDAEASRTKLTCLKLEVARGFEPHARRFFTQAISDIKIEFTYRRVGFFDRKIMENHVF